MNYSYIDITKTSKNFRDVASDLLHSNTKSFNTYINYFRSFCDDNPIIQDIIKPIKECNFNSKEWYNNAIEQRSSFIGSGDITLPTDKISALKVIYDLLWSANALDTLLSLGHATMFAKKYDEQLRKVNDVITFFFIRYISRELENLIEGVKPENMGNQNVNNFNIYAPSNIATNSTNVNQTLQYNNSQELLNLIAELKTAVINSELSEPNKSDALDTIDMIENEATQQPPNTSRVTKLLNLMPSVESIVNIGEKITSLLP
ncbi:MULTISPECIES: hypothetical protein [Bacillus cereus group]|uniref:hypothetical protein n=1 Tax=Bacillus cereus group TaxID=86661 RepID=UPI0001A05E13|nr:hypothetical protein [Bacillus cereus]EEK89224.1 hypothetical protein bcere0011_23680 [Bacillus cereus m1550]MRB98155.1 hypothetical protein [Bacillus thuringiensis]